MTKHAARAGLGLCSLMAILVLNACGSSAPQTSGQGSAGSTGTSGTNGAAGTSPSGGTSGQAGGAGGAQMIGTSGGTVNASEVTLTIPAGALTTDTPITVVPTTPPAGYAAASMAYDFGPAGTMFAQPVTVSIPLASATPGVHLFWSNANGGFDDIGGTVVGAMITGQVMHFSVGFAAVPAADGGSHNDGAAALDGGASSDGGGNGDAASAGHDAADTLDAGTTGGDTGTGEHDGSASGGDASARGSDASAGGEDASAGGGDAATSGSDASAGGSDASSGAADASAGGSDAGAGQDAGGVADAGAGIDAASLCAAFALNAPVFTPTLVTDGAAAPAESAYTGGTIPSGQAYLSGYTHYGSQYGGPAQEVMIFDMTAHTVRIVDRVGQAEYYVGLENVTNADADTIVGDVVCSSYPQAMPSQLAWYYSVGQRLVMSMVGSSDVGSYLLP